MWGKEGIIKRASIENLRDSTDKLNLPLFISTREDCQSSNIPSRALLSSLIRPSTSTPIWL